MRTTLALIAITFLPFSVFSQEDDWAKENELAETLVTNVVENVEPDTETRPGTSIYELEEPFVVPIRDDFNFTLRNTRYTDADGDGWGPDDEIVIEWLRSSDNAVLKYRISHDENSITHWVYTNPPSWANMGAFPMFTKGKTPRKHYTFLLDISSLRFDPEITED